MTAIPRKVALALAARAALPLGLVMAAFVAFVAWNGAIAMGDRGAHSSAFNLTNFYFFLLCAFFVLLPQNLTALPRLLPRLRGPRFLAGVAIAFAFYWATYANSHPYNQQDLRFFLRNELLYWLDQKAWLRGAAFLPMAWMALTLATAPLPEPRMRLLLLFAPLAIVLHPLIEQRYYLAPILLFQLWRAPESRRVEAMTLATYVVAGFFFLRGISRGEFFL